MNGFRWGTPLRPALATLALALMLVAPPALASSVADSFGGRGMFVHAPASQPSAHSRVLVIVLHGGLGNAERIAGKSAESGLNMDAAADRDGFVVAYLDGTPVTRRLGPRFLGWNAGGGCCGVPAETNVDDVAYLNGAVAYLADKYGIDPRRVYGMGHSNGAMMVQRLLCESDLLAAGVAISGPLNLPVERCPAAKGKRVLAIHGADDANVPLGGGRGTKGLSGVAYSSEARAEQVVTASGGQYTLDVVPGADHMLDHIQTAIMKAEGVSIADKAVRFFGLSKP